MMMQSISFSLLLVAVVTTTTTDAAFLQPQRRALLPIAATTTTTASSSSSRYMVAKNRSNDHNNNYNNSNDQDDDMDISLQELEKAREAFESMMKELEASPPPSTTRFKTIPQQQQIYCPLTQSDRLRRLLEIDLLESLEYSDDAIEDLMHLWMHERDGTSAQELCQMEQSCSPGLRQEEIQLKEMVHKYGGAWVEPASRLAALKYMQGDSVESQEWCLHVLERKPWHFETLQTQLLNALRLEGNDKSSMAVLKAARMTLPPLSSKSLRRRKWVNRAVGQARAALVAKEDDLKRYQRTVLDTEESQNSASWQ